MAGSSEVSTPAGDSGQAAKYLPTIRSSHRVRRAPLKADIRLPVCSDKDDQKFLEIARDSSATTLITKDKALLKLARKIRKAGLFSVETPEQFLIAWTQENSKTNDNQVKQ
jgi:predicted nucleic acid-binding protein